MTYWESCRREDGVLCVFFEPLNCDVKRLMISYWFQVKQPDVEGFNEQRGKRQ